MIDDRTLRWAEYSEATGARFQQIRNLLPRGYFLVVSKSGGRYYLTLESRYKEMTILAESSCIVDLQRIANSLAVKIHLLGIILT